MGGDGQASQHLGSFVLCYCALGVAGSDSRLRVVSAFVWDYFKTFSAILNGGRAEGCV